MQGKKQNKTKQLQPKSQATLGIRVRTSRELSFLFAKHALLDKFRDLKMWNTGAEVK